MVDSPDLGFEEVLTDEEFLTQLDRPIRVLHVEDDPDMTALLEASLARHGDTFEVDAATDPVAALETLDLAETDCIVCDYDMPRLDGLEVLERVREQSSDVPFILFTGKGSEEIASEAISRGVTEYLQKGTGTDQFRVLANRIEQTVARYRAEQHLVRGFSAMEAAHDGISILNEDGEFIYVNRAYAETTGYDREALLGRHWEVLYRESDLDHVYSEMLPAARESGWSGETTYVRADGEPVVVDHRLVYTDDDTMICTITDTPSADDVREELSVKERAMDEAPIGIVLTDPDRDNEIVYANDGFLELTGYSREYVRGRNCRFLQGEATAEEPVDELREAIAAAEPVTVELRNYREDGELFWNRVTIAPLFDEAGDVDYFVGFQEDVTERNEMRAKREAWTDMMSQFGRVLSHDIRTPLDVARGRLELARETGDLEDLEDARGHRPPRDARDRPGRRDADRRPRRR